MPPLHKEENLNHQHRTNEVSSKAVGRVRRDVNTSTTDTNVTPASILHHSGTEKDESSISPSNQHHDNSARFAPPPQNNDNQRRRRRRFCQWSETATSSWHMAKIWIFGIMMPIAVITWFITQSAAAVVLSILVTPLVAILQGSLAISRYRIQFGDCPIPKTPSHGIVKCVSKRELRDSNNHENENTATLPGESATFSDPQLYTQPSTNEASPPLRLLVIGDSLAIGVGQSKSSMPIMPETIAKSLSKAMNGRSVLWNATGRPEPAPDGSSGNWNDP